MQEGQWDIVVTQQVRAELVSLLPRLRRSPALSALLDGVNIAALGLMAAVGLQLARASIVDGPTAALGLAAAALLAWGRINPTWIVLGGGAIGVGIRALGWA